MSPEERLEALVDVALAQLLAGDEVDAEELAREHGVRPEAAADALRAIRALQSAADDSDEERIAALTPDDVATSDVALPADYELQGELGRGGMGVVYRVRQRSLDRDVALKLLRVADGASEEVLRRFEREARLLAKLRHRHVVGVHEVGATDGRLYFTMDLVPGTSLRERLKEGPLPPASAVRLVRQVAAAVAYVHSHGLVHRDLKPANVLLDETGDAVVTDFGLALDLLADEGLTETGQLLGTPAYMAPEQARGDAADERTDVHALGVLLFEALTGRRPFEGEGPLQVLHAVLHHELSELPSTVPQPLRVIVAKAMAKEPSDRYVTAQALLLDLERYERGEPIHAKPPTAWELTWRWARRHAAALAVAVLLTLAFGAYLFVVSGERRPLDPEVLRATVQELLDAGRHDAARSLVEDARASGVDADTVADLARVLLLGESRRLRKAGDLDGALEAAEQAWTLVFDVPYRRGEELEPEQQLALRDAAAESALILRRMGRANDAVARLDAANDRLRFSRMGAAYSYFADPLLSRALDSPGDTDAALGLLGGSLPWIEESLTRAITGDVRWVGPLVTKVLTRYPARPMGVPPVPGVSRRAHSEELARLLRETDVPEHRATYAYALAVLADLPSGAGRDLARLSHLPPELEVDAERVVFEWERVEGLSPAESHRERVRLAVTKLEVSATSDVLLERWLQLHTDLDAVAGPDAATRWWEAHGQEDPLTWLLRGLAMSSVDEDELLRRMDGSERDRHRATHALRLLHPGLEPVIASGRSDREAWTIAIEGPPPPPGPQRIVLARFDQDEHGRWSEEPAVYQNEPLEPGVSVGWDKHRTTGPALQAAVRMFSGKTRARHPVYRDAFRWVGVVEENEVVDHRASWDRVSPGQGVGATTGMMSPRAADPLWVTAPFDGHRPLPQAMDGEDGSLTLMAFAREGTETPRALSEWRDRAVEILRRRAPSDPELRHDRARFLDLYGALQVGSALPLPDALRELRQLSDDPDPNLAELALPARLMAGDETAIDLFDEPVDPRRPHRTPGVDEHGVFWRVLARRTESDRIRRFALDRAPPATAPEPARPTWTFVWTPFALAGGCLGLLLFGAVSLLRRRPSGAVLVFAGALPLLALRLGWDGLHLQLPAVASALIALAAVLAWRTERRRAAGFVATLGVVAATAFVLEADALGRAAAVAALVLTPFLFQSAPPLAGRAGGPVVPRTRSITRGDWLPAALPYAFLVFLVGVVAIGPTKDAFASFVPLVGLLVAMVLAEFAARLVARRPLRSDTSIALWITVPTLVAATALAVAPDSVRELDDFLDPLVPLLLIAALIEARGRGLRRDQASSTRRNAEGSARQA